MKDIFDERQFYELMQQYRLAPMVSQSDVIACFESVKKFAREAVASDREDCAQLCNDMQTPDGEKLAALIRSPGTKKNHDSDCAVHNEPAFPNGQCSCSLRHRLAGDGCDVCNPANALEHARDTIDDAPSAPRYSFQSVAPPN